MRKEGIKRIFSGCIESKTKESALAAIMLALFFLARTFKIQLIPGVFLFDFSAIFLFTAASFLSWPYTLLFSASNMLLGSNAYGFFAALTGTQMVFWLSKIVGKRWVPHIVVMGQVSLPTYGVIMHLTGLMDFKAYMIGLSIPFVVLILSTYFGSLVVWGVLRRFNVVD